MPITEYINPGTDWAFRQQADRTIIDHVSGDAVVIDADSYTAQQTYVDAYGSQSWREIGRFPRASAAMEALDNAR